MPVGLYLAFVTRPTYGLEGLWIGLIIGMGLLAFVLVLQ
jgi:Na+-driven multidrug efflux pump